MSSPPMPTRHSAALYDALEAVDAFIRTRPTTPARSEATAPPAAPAAQPTPRRRTKRKAAAPPALPAAQDAMLR